MSLPQSPSRDPLFFCSTLVDGDDVILEDEEAKHIKAQRLQPGDRLALFDGNGRVARGAIRSISRRDVRIAITQRVEEPPLTPHVELCCAVPKGDRMATLLDMVTQLGMSRLTPIRWSRGVVEPGARTAERWRRICIEACKQSRRAHLPQIGTPELLTQAATRVVRENAVVILAHPAPDLSRRLLSISAPVDRVALFVGPEGGLTDDELTELRKTGAELLDLGPGILRIETAAIAGIASINLMLTLRNASGEKAGG